MTSTTDFGAQHLREIAAEPGPPLSERIGSPEAYATELLASAGVAATALPHPPLLTRAGALVERARISCVGQEVVRTWPFLRPAWWVLRAYSPSTPCRSWVGLVRPSSAMSTTA